MDLRNLNPKIHKITVGGRYLLRKRLGGGSFGQIFTAIRPEDRAGNFAIKLEKRVPNTYLTLGKEAKIISDMKSEFGFPTLYDYGKDEDINCNYIAINLLGQSLEKLFKTCNNKLSLKTVLMLGNQMLIRLESLHNKGYIHRDIKPENFCVGMGSSKKTLFLIDFGLARSYKDQTGKHIPFKENKGLVGTARYASINAHLGSELSRRDDLEEIGYVLIYFLQGSLPWQNTKGQDKAAKYQMIKDCKMTTTVDSLCKGIPEEFATFMNYVKGLGFSDEPNYGYLKGLFKNLIMQQGWELDYDYDWIPGSKDSVTLKDIEKPIIQTVHVREYKTVAFPKSAKNETGKKFLFKEDPEIAKNDSADDVQKKAESLEDESFHNKKIKNIARVLSYRFKKRKEKNEKNSQAPSKYEVVTSYHSSKVINFTQGFIEGEVPPDISIHNAPNDNIEQTTTFPVKKKEFFSGVISGFFNSSDSLDSPDNQNLPSHRKRSVSPFAPDSIQKETKERVPKQSFFKRFSIHHKMEDKDNQDDLGENLSESSICEWDGGVNLVQKVQKQKFNANKKNI